MPSPPAPPVLRTVPRKAVSRKWSTPRWLWTVTGLGMALTFLFWAAATSVLLGGQGAVRTAKDRAVPAYTSARIARAALADADQAAWQSFRSGAARFTGPGQRFRDDLTTAGDHLTRLAQLDRGGAAGRDDLRDVNAQVVTYQGLVEQADASYRAGPPKLGLAYLGYASDLLHDPGDGPLAGLGRLADRDRAAVEREHGSAWTGTGAATVTALLAALPLAFLGYVQVAMAARFRRVLSPPLLAASGVLLVLLAWTTVTFTGAGHALGAASRTGLPRFDATVQRQTGQAEAGARALRGGGHDATAGLDLAAADEAGEPLRTELARAADPGGLPAALPLLSALAMALIAVGGGLRLREFPR